ncbi:hypothetical protein JCM10908_001770 [Rhodotorula pacifica]|uniref:uncharacterized protein n=1 Tax=Rhodotorula pacifica TaxID=1495444 RepID=UPI003177071B
MMTTTALAARFASPLGAAHLASPEDQGAALKAVLKLFRRKPSTSASTTVDESTITAGAAFPASPAAQRAGLECTLERSTSFTIAYEPTPLPPIFEAVDAAERRLSPPPTYESATSPAVHALEEDILITESGDVFIKASLALSRQREEDLPIKVETPAERKMREKQERLERKRRALLEQDRLLGDALDKLGF